MASPEPDMDIAQPTDDVQEEPLQSIESESQDLPDPTEVDASMVDDQDEPQEEATQSIENEAQYLPQSRVADVPMVGNQDNPQENEITSMTDNHDESQENRITMEHIQEHKEGGETTVSGVQEQPHELEDICTVNIHLAQSQEQEESDSLFIPEVHRASSPCITNRSSLTPTLTPVSHKPIPGLSMFAKIRNLQLRNQQKRAGGAKSHSSRLYQSAPDNETYLEAVQNMPTVDEVEQASREALKEFQKHKAHYDKLREKNGGKLSFKQDVEWMKIKGAENARLAKRKRDIARQQEDKEESDLFPEIYPTNDTNDNDSDVNERVDLDSGPSSRKRRREPPRKEPKALSMREAEMESMRVALDADSDLPKKKRRKQAASGESQNVGTSGRGKSSKSKSTRVSKAKTATGKRGGRKSAKQKRELNNATRMATSLLNNNVFEQQAAEDAAEQPTFRSRNKQDALKELIASVPGPDKKEANSDMTALWQATKDFDGHGAAKADRGMWLVRGMKTSLKHYQLLGSAFMRRRENSAEQPRGGLMADQMGLGKTLMMLANIVNGRPPKGDKGPKTTLLVASPALLSQWAKEIETHTNCNLHVMRYGAGTRIDSNRAYEVLHSHDIVLTTYTEIMRSYPKNEPPIECQTAEAKIEWWKKVYEEQRGVLHRMMFLRVVLDEAQAIKNHTGRTSIACRALMARHKWALSGTPILNGLPELYPYFKFLGVPHTGSFKIFKHNYCDTGDVDNIERLLSRLAQFMIRRTHADYMFGAPILKLPKADQATHWCPFNAVERNIYDIVRHRFAMNINMLAKRQDTEQSYNNALVMLLRLRQLTSHVLMLQFVMRDLLEREDIEKIREVVNQAAADSNTHRGRTIIAVRKQLEVLAAEERKRTADKEAHPHLEEDSPIEEEDGLEEREEDTPEPDQNQDQRRRLSSGKTFGKGYNFKPYLNSLATGESWEKAKKKAKCNYCNQRPRLPHVTSCGHLLCLECVGQLQFEAAQKDQEHAECKACGQVFQYAHPCVENLDSQEFDGRETRTQAKKREKERRRIDREDIAEDWLSLGGQTVLPSAKTIAIKAQIINWINENPNVKIIIYTQFLAMIRILAKVCQEEGWKTEQYHGKLSLGARGKAISTFAENPNVRIFLASFRCGGLGLNLTMASRVIVLDPWWNSAAEQQAFCRVFRIGQKETTFMTRFCVRDTIDERLIEMQEEKKKEIDEVMENHGKKKFGIPELMRLFGNIDEDDSGKPFIMVDNPDPRGGFRADRDDEGYADEF